MAKKITGARKNDTAKGRELGGPRKPKFQSGTLFVSQQAVVAADENGDLIRIDPINGTIRRVRWEQ